MGNNGLTWGSLKRTALLPWGEQKLNSLQHKFRCKANTSKQQQNMKKVKNYKIARKLVIHIIKNFIFF